MTLLAGVWRFSTPGGARPLPPLVAAMVDAQRWPATNRRATPMAVADLGAVALARVVSRGGDDGCSGAAARAGSGPFALVADVRIDNREELLRALGLGGADVDDAALVAAAYRRWGEAMVDHLLGDYAIACWNPADQALTLIRDPTGQRPLHYHVGDGFVAFASMPQGLLAIDGVRRDLDLDTLARFVGDVPLDGPGTFFRAVARVEPAQVVRMTRSGVEARRYWTMPTREIRFRSDDDYVEAFREQLDRATGARMRCAGDVTAAHLSGGLDSAAVTATAARLAAGAGGTVLAITSAPRAGFAGPIPHGRIADESGPASALAQRYPRIRHLVLRSGIESPLDFLDDDARLFAQPVGHPCNNVWWRRANAAARDGGAAVLLTGEMGNLSVSAGGLGVLSDYVRSGRWAAWWREVTALAGTGPRWRGLLASSFGPWLPRNAARRLMRLSAGGRLAAPAMFVAAAAQRSGMATLARGADPYGRSDREVRWDGLRLFDPGNFRKGTLLRWGIDERDPTADRRLIEFCMALPPDQLLGGGQTRRMARRGLSDRVPDAVLHGARGYQYADWYEGLSRERLMRSAERAAASPDARAVIDFDLVHRLIADWPVADLASARTIGTYRIGLLRALSAGAFALNAGA